MATYKDWDQAGRAGVSALEATDAAWAEHAKKAQGTREQGNEKSRGLGFNLVCIADVESEPVSWLWPGYLARGKLTLLGGDPDLGKSLVCINAAARHSRGLHWPHGPRADIGGTIFICSEDGIADTVRPRAEAADADLTQLHVFESTLLKNGKRKTFNLQDDLGLLGQAIDANRARQHD